MESIWSGDKSIVWIILYTSTTPLHPFCTAIISISMNTVIVKKTSNMQVVEMQITLQDEHHLVNYNKIHEKL